MPFRSSKIFPSVCLQNIKNQNDGTSLIGSHPMGNFTVSLTLFSFSVYNCDIPF